jgi:uncharacterized protein (DUF58 family)
VRFRFTKRAVVIGAGAVLLFAVGTNVQAGWVLTIASLLLGVLFAGALLPLRGLHGLDVVRRAPRTATAGRPLPISMTVTNTSRRLRTSVRIADDFCGRAWTVVSSLQPGETREVGAERRGERRGVYQRGSCELETGTPFGVVRVRRTTELDSPLVVHPVVYEVPSRAMRGAGGLPAAAPIGDVSSVREYRRGDPLRHIHWRSVAKRGQLMVREFDRERDVETAIVAHARGDPDMDDAIASTSCSLALAFLSRGDVRMLSADRGSVGTTLARSPAEVLDWGARLSADGVRLGDVLAAARDSRAVVCVCPADTAEVDRLAALAATTLLAVVMVNDGSAADRALSGRLRAAGASVAEITTGEVERWFANGCVFA